ncbi:late promoter transcription accessory protein [Hyphomonas sp.]|uniref:late promoter transcription accessory protein n=1 Tax=Hyphomonas sp. TaxID=87 RepID=UPI000C8FEDAA|nr:late promoter transcription accessory protein [Hyphomonas sp.]MAL45499.1 hypothetical protein [Hyphomonas sp.]
MILTEEEKAGFSKKVENVVRERGGTYLEAVIELCEKHEIEPGIVAKSLSKPIIEKLKVEGQDLNILPKQETQLPI